VLVGNVAYQPLDIRLAQWLLSYAMDSQPIDISQMELARELGTAREVVGRLLKTFEDRGWVRMSRLKIHVTDRMALEALLSGDRE
jgi:CRP/FNR family transcriptional regulator